MTKLTREEALEFIFTEEYAEIKYEEFTKDWEDWRKNFFRGELNKKYEAGKVLGFDWGTILEFELSQLIEDYSPKAREAYIDKRFEEEGYERPPCEFEYTK